MNKPNGFILAIGNLQYIEMGDDLYEAPRDADLDPDGYPYGMLPHRGLSSTKDELINGIAQWGGHKIESLNFEAPPEILAEIQLREKQIVERKAELKRLHAKEEEDRRIEYEKFRQRAAQNDEPILDDDYPIHIDYWYLFDGEPQRSPIKGDVRRAKLFMGVKEVRRCDAVKRGLPRC